MEFGKLIKDARLRKGLQQQHVAKALNVAPGYISSIESGKRNWPKQYIRALSEVLDVDEVAMAIAAGLISGTSRGEGGETVTRPDAPYDAVSAQIARTVTRWPPDQRLWLLRLMEATDAMLGATAPAEDDVEESA